MIEQHLGGFVIYKKIVGFFNDENGNTLVDLLRRKDSLVIEACHHILNMLSPML
jgi:hypothetical protein